MISGSRFIHLRDQIKKSKRSKSPQGMVGRKSKAFSLPPTPSLCMTVSFVLTAKLGSQANVPETPQGHENWEILDAFTDRLRLSNSGSQEGFFSLSN